MSKKAQRPPKNRQTVIAWQRKQRRGVVAKKTIIWSQVVKVVLNRLRFWLSVAIMCAVIASPYLVWRYFEEHAIFVIERVVVFGDVEYLSQEELQGLTESVLYKNFVGFDVSQFQHIIEQNPWVKSVKVTRKKLNELEVNIEERKPVAIWNNEFLIEQDGTIFKPTSLPNQEFVLLLAPDGYEEKMLAQMDLVVNQLSLIHLSMRQLSMDSRLAWQIGLTNEIELFLGTEEFDRRLKRFIDYYPYQLADKVAQIKSIDLRYDNGFAVKWLKDAL